MPARMKPAESKQSVNGPPDGGYGWVIVIATGIVAGFITTVFKSTGIIYDAVLQQLPYSRTAAATAAILPRIVATFVAIVGSKIAEVYSYKFTIFVGVFLVSLGLATSSFVTDNIYLFVLTYGIISGLGCGLALVPSTVINGLYFTKRRSIAMAISLTLGGASTFFMPPVLQILIDEYSLDGALLLWSGIVLHGCIPALLLRQPTWGKPGNVGKKVVKEDIEIDTPIDVNNIQNGPKDDQNGEVQVSPEAERFLKQSQVASVEKQSCKCGLFLICRTIVSEVLRDCRRYFTNYVFILLLMNRIAFFFTTASIYLILPQFASEQLHSYGVTATQVAFLLSVMSIGEMSCRLWSGCIINALPNHKKTTLNMSLMGIALSMLCFQFAPVSYVGFIVLVTVNGIFTGYAFVMVFVIIFDLLGTQQAPGAHALQQLLVGVATMAAGPVMAKIRDITGSYMNCWNVLAALIVLSVVLWILEPIYFKRHCATKALETDKKSECGLT